MSLSWITPDLPKPFDADRCNNGFERWSALADRPVFEHLAQQIGDIAANSPKKDVLAAMFGNSPYLTNLCLRDPDIVCLTFDQGLDAAFDAALDPVHKSANASALDQANTMAEVRKAKRRAALVIAMADICKAWTLDKITSAISTTAEVTLEFALAHCLSATARQRKFDLPHPDDPLRDCGIFAIGMGKLGAKGLNFSSIST